MSGMNPNFMAGGDINPSRFVKMDPSNDNRVVQCGFNQMPLGVSQQGTQNTPTASNSTLAAQSGNPIQVYGEGDSPPLLEFGATVTRGNQLRSDAVGRGIPAAASGEAQKIGAYALESGLISEKHRVQVRAFVAPAAASY